MPNVIKVRGGNPLSGVVQNSGSKNAALPMICAALLTSEKCIFRNVPFVEDVRRLLDIMRCMGVEIQSNPEEHTLEIQAKNIDPSIIADNKNIKRMRASILLVGATLARCREISLFAPGGCVLGARSTNIHWDAFRELGADVEITEDNERINVKFSRKNLSRTEILFPEASVTGTENILIFLSNFTETSKMFFAAAEKHVQALAIMLQQMGVSIQGIGTHCLSVTGSTHLKGGEFIIPPDGIAAGSYAIGGIVTGGDLTIKNVDHDEMYSFYAILNRIGVEIEYHDTYLRILPNRRPLQAINKVQTAIYPGFSTDLQSPLGVLLTQCEGESMIFETLFENRLTYLSELEKMGASISIINSRMAIIQGKSNLQGALVQSWDLRAGVSMILAGLLAEGVTTVTNIEYIHRGYENFIHRMRSIGADICEKSID